MEFSRDELEEQVHMYRAALLRALRDRDRWRRIAEWIWAANRPPE